MAMNAALDSSKTNKRLIMLAVVLGMMGAILVYVAFSRDTTSGGGGSASGEMASVVVAKADIPARTRITADMLQVKLVPVTAVSDLAFTDTAQAVGQITRFPITMNQQVLSSQVIPSTGSVSRSLAYVIPKDKRAIAVQASTIATAGGLILPGDYVDVLVVYDIEDEAGKKFDAFVVQTILQNIEVVAVSQTVVDTVADDASATTGGQRVRNSEAKPDPSASTYTLLVTPEQAQRLFLAEENGRSLRFSLRSFGDSTERPIEYLTERDLIPVR